MSKPRDEALMRALDDTRRLLFESAEKEAEWNIIAEHLGKAILSIGKAMLHIADRGEAGEWWKNDNEFN